MTEPTGELLTNPQEFVTANLKFEPDRDFDTEQWKQRTQALIDTVVGVETQAVGIEPSIAGITNWLIGKVSDKTGFHRLQELSQLPSWQNPFLLFLLHKNVKTLFETLSPCELRAKVQPALPVIEAKVKQRGEISGWEILPNDFDIERHLTEKPTLLLSCQSPKALAQAKLRGYFAGRIGFTADATNELFTQKQDGVILITSFKKLSDLCPLAALSEPGGWTEKEWTGYTGVPLGGIDLILPARLFPPRLPSATENRLADLASDKKEKALQQIKKYLKPQIPKSYVKSLIYTHQQTGDYLTSGQKEILKSQSFEVEEFWDKGLKPLEEFE